MGMLQGPTGIAWDTWHRKDMGGPGILGTAMLLSSWYLVPGAWYRTHPAAPTPAWPLTGVCIKKQCS